MKKIQRRKIYCTRWLIHATAGALACTIATVPEAAAAQSVSINFDIPAQPLAQALMQLSRQANVNIVADSSLTRNRQAPAVHGAMSVEQALDRLLQPSGLSYRANGNSFILERRGGHAAPGSTEGGSTAAESESAEQIVITGSRIRGAPPSSPVIIVTQAEMRRAGQTDLGEVIRSIPQNFNGGTNPGIGFGAESFGAEPSDGSSGPNLRGLGPSATLTLLNGRRLPYAQSTQGVDISAIPLAAVGRVEIVTDGASALYGSDAVGGVVNVILNRGYSGLTATGRIGGSTSGGNEGLQLDATAGKTWTSGSLLLAGYFSRSSAIRAGQRNYAARLDPSYTLYPRLRTWSALGSAHQDLVPGVTLNLDALFTDRFALRKIPTTAAGDYRYAGSRRPQASQSLMIAPYVDFGLPGDWRGSVNFSYGRERSYGDVQFYAAGNRTSRQILDVRNTTHVAEANGEGPLFHLRAGNVRLAIGAGYRSVGMDRRTGSSETSLVGFTDSRDSFYGYGELLVPLVSPDQKVSGVYRLSLSTALRYENYQTFGDVVTPKIGITYAPSLDFTLSGTWGRSFKTPTLLQQNFTQQILHANAPFFGGAGYPANATALYLVGGNKDLGPERSTNWSATVAITPRALEGARLQFSYFHIDYRDRITNPIPVSSAALSNPAYGQFVTLSPTAGQVANALAKAATPSDFISITGRPFDATDVIAIIDDRYTNVARQRVSGLDMTASYRATLGSASALNASLNVAYLRSSQVASKGQPVTVLAGTIFSPPHWRARAALGWSNRTLGVNAYANYVGALDDIRTATVYRLGSQVTFDLTASLRTHAAGFDGIQFQISAHNLFNASPRAIMTTSASAAPYESTNYSPIGRYLSLSVSKTF